MMADVSKTKKGELKVTTGIKGKDMVISQPWVAIQADGKNVNIESGGVRVLKFSCAKYTVNKKTAKSSEDAIAILAK